MADEPQLEDLAALLPPLLRALDALAFVSRRLDPHNPAPLIAAIGAPDEALAAERPRLDAWPERLRPVASRLGEAADRTISAFRALREGAGGAGDPRALFRALGQAPRAQEALYPLAPVLPPVSRFFLDAPRRNDPDLLASLAADQVSPVAGLVHVGEPGARGGFSAYAPEYYDPAEAWPLVMALHGGAGNGRSFLWSWLREARSYGAILIAPTAVGDTWSISGEDADTPNLARILAFARQRWTLDPARLLLTGMSDGGTFSYVSGLEPASPFTHLAPACAAFHPALAAMADRERLAGLPIHIAHGVHDWMFPVDMAREAAAALSAAGAKVAYQELADLGHAYPREINGQVLRWLMTTDRG